MWITELWTRPLPERDPATELHLNYECLGMEDNGGAEDSGPNPTTVNPVRSLAVKR